MDSSWARARAALGSAATLLIACSYPPTEVVVAMGTDAPLARALSVRVTARRGSSTSAPAETHMFVRGGGARGAATLPGSFAVVPGDGPRDGAATVVFEAALEAGAAGEPAVNFRRVARFSFTPRTPTLVRVYFAMACGNTATGCTTPAVACTVSQRCEEEGLTCGDRGECVSSVVTPEPIVTTDAQTPSRDAGADATVTPDVATDASVAPDARDVGTDASVTPADVRDDVPVALPAPRPVAPLSTALTISRRPILRWALAPGTNGAQVEVCRDRACTAMVTRFDAVGSSGAPAMDLPTGVLFWRLRGSADGTTGTAFGPTWQFTVGARSAPRDGSWGTTLDVNGDGFADVAIGASGVDNSTGRAYVHLGSAAGVRVPPATSLDGSDGVRAYFGSSVASAGDVNGDGFADLVVGASGAAGDTGRAYVHLGSASGLDVTPAVTLTGPDGASSEFGRAVASAGDVNGDGYADLLIGAPLVGGRTGRAYVYLGSASGPGATPATTLLGLDGTGAQFGFSIASVGDTNGDGYADIAVGAYAAGSGIGSVNLYLGSASGSIATPATTLVGPDGASGNFGYSLASAGDVDGDGYADLAVGAFGVGGGVGRVHVYYSGPAGLRTTPAITLIGPDGGFAQFGSELASAGDVNSDGYVDLVVGAAGANSFSGRAHLYFGSASGLSASPSISFTAPEGGQFGHAVMGAGDTNGDGHGDLVISAIGVSASTGHAYIYLGSPMGPTAPPAVTLSGPDGTNGNFGISVASAGDGLNYSTRAVCQSPAYTRQTEGTVSTIQL